MPASGHLSVRLAEPSDEAEVVALWQVCGLVVPYNDPAADFRFACAQPCSAVLLGMDGTGRIAGGVMVGYDGHRGWLYYVAVRPDCRGSGFGRRMVGAAEAWLEARGVPKVQLLVRDTNATVLAFYERLGFAVAPRVVMSRWLKPPA